MKNILYLITLLISPIVLAEDISLCKKGWFETQSGNHQEAIQLLKNCIEKGDLSNSSLARTYRNIGIAYKRNKQYKKAIDNYNKALSLNPTDPWDDYINRGNAWSESGKYKNAFEDYDKALKVKPNYNQAYYNRGIVYEKQGNNEQALKEFRKAYNYGLRSKELHERFVAYGLIKEN